MDPYQVLNRIAGRYSDILKDNLVGIYLHGSLAMGCYTERSDIDCLVVVNEPLDFKTKRLLADELLQLQGLPEKGIEMSVILLKHARDFKCPTPFELHFSDMLKENYEKDRDYICEGADKDLAAHMTVIKHRGKSLYGRNIPEVFGDIPREYYIDSLLYDMKDAREGIIHNPVYYLLNLCRVLCFLKHGRILSKLEAGNWVIEHLPTEFRLLLKNAVGTYQDRPGIEKWNHDELIGFAGFMLDEIYRLADSEQGED